MMMQSIVSRAVKGALLGTLATATLVSGVAVAEEEVSQDVERIEVTGSRIKRTDMETASPLVVISSESIEKGGFNSVQDVLDNLSQNSGGSMSQQEVHGFTPAASSVNLRGVGAGRVLTLINGKRVPKYPFAAGGTDNFVDTANMPLGAIERIEILTTGASAIYGSDAMGGVINIILKKDVDETTVKYRFSDTEDGGMQRNNISFLTGTSNDTSNVTFFVEYDDREALKGTDRPEWGTDLIPGAAYAGYSTYGATLYKDIPATTNDEVLKTLSEQECTDRGMKYHSDRCGFDRSAMRDFMPEQQRLSTMINFTRELNADHQLYGRMDYTHSEVYTEIEPATFGNNDFLFNVVGDDVIVKSQAFPDMQQTITGAAAAGSTAFGGDFAGFDDGQYYYTRRLLEMGPRRTDFETNNFSFLTGLEGYLTEDIEYDLSWSFARQKVNTVSEGSPTVQGMFDYIVSDGGQSILNEISAEDAAAIGYQGNKRGESTLSVISFGISGEAWELPAGPIAYAAGVEYGREWFFSADDSFTSVGGVLGKGGSSAEGARKQYAGYAEFAIPVIDELVVTAAGRYDYYDDLSDVGGRFTPQVSFEYRPMDELLLRGLFAETFRAPDMQRLFGDPTRAYAGVVDTPRCEASGDPNSPECQKIDSLPITIGANPNLKEETGTNWNLGVVWDYEGLNMSVDYWNVEIDDLVSDPTAQYILDHADVYADKIERDANGQLVQVNTQAINMSSQETSGIDFSVSYLLEAGNLGDLKFSLDGTFLTKWEEQLTAESDPINKLGGEDSAPKLRANFNTGWTYDDIGVNLLVKYIDSYHAENKDSFLEWGIQDEYDVEVDSHVEVNLMGSYNYDAWRFTGGINNLFDAEPEIDATQKSWPHYNRGYYNVIGREFYLSAEVTF